MSSITEASCTRPAAVLLLLLLATSSLPACSPDSDAPDAARTPPRPTRETAPQAEPAAPAPSAADWPRLLAEVQAEVDSADRLLRRIPALSRDERARLRRDVNAVQIQRARMLGVRAIGSIDALVQAGRLTPLADTTDYWVIRELDYSVPFVTPATQVMLEEIGRRFHAGLDSIGAPRFRLDITSVLRTPEKQAELRRRNSNASRIESAHEFGTTVDVAYRKFAAPATDGPRHAAVRQVADSLYMETARLRGAELQALLGRVLLTMQREGKLMVMMERRQTVYHMTVARRLNRNRAGG